MPSGFTIDVDTRALQHAIALLQPGLDQATSTASRDTADDVARRVAAGVPVLSGTLRSTVGVAPVGDGAEVHYGGALPYARYIERRSGAVESGIVGASTTFARAMTDEAEKVVARL